MMQHSQQHKHVPLKGGTADKTALCAGASLVHLGIDHRSYKHHKVSAALMLIVLTLFEVAVAAAAVRQPLCSSWVSPHSYVLHALRLLGIGLTGIAGQPQCISEDVMHHSHDLHMSEGILLRGLLWACSCSWWRGRSACASCLPWSRRGTPRPPSPCRSLSFLSSIMLADPKSGSNNMLPCKFLCAVRSQAEPRLYTYVSNRLSSLTVPNCYRR